MKLAVIIPNYRHAQVMQLSFHFLLAQKVLKSRIEVSDFYRWRSSRGDHIIVDNGAPEGEPISFDDLMHVATLVRATEIVLPDVLRDAETTLRLSTEPGVLRCVPPRQRFVVPQGKTWEEWYYCLNELVKRCAPATIGVPKWTSELPNGRLMALQLIYGGEFHRRCNVHLLGMARPLRQEIDELNYDFVRSIDTALPIAMAQCGLRVENDERASIDWNATYDSRLAEHNIEFATNYAAKCVPMSMDPANFEIPR